jgi:hypothetical protein
MFNMSRENAYEKLHSLKKESDQDRVSHFEMITASQRQSTDRAFAQKAKIPRPGVRGSFKSSLFI